MKAVNHLSSLVLFVITVACASTDHNRVSLEVQLQIDENRSSIHEMNLFSDSPDIFVAGFPTDDRQLQSQFVQIANILGREDLVGNKSNPIDNIKCPTSLIEIDLISLILNEAASSKIIIINEAHHRSLHRVLTLRLLEPLYAKGFNYFAAETFSIDGGKRAAPPAYLLDAEGYYSQEAIFGRAARKALRLGYTLAAYEMTREQLEASAPNTIEESMSIREEAQTLNFIARILNEDASAKVIVHVGYSHTAEAPLPGFGEDYIKWFAARLKEYTSIDPYTINQTDCQGGGDTLQIGRTAPRAPTDAFDIIVDHPLPVYEHGRPAWRQSIGDVPTLIPSELWPGEGWVVIEARHFDEPDEAVPVDRVAVNASEDRESVQLMLPPGRYRVRAATFADVGIGIDE